MQPVGSTPRAKTQRIRVLNSHVTAAPDYSAAERCGDTSRTRHVPWNTGYQNQVATNIVFPFRSMETEVVIKII